MGYLKGGWLLLVIGTTCAATICEPDTVKHEGMEMCFCLGDGTGWVCAVTTPADFGSVKLTKQTPSDDERCEPGRIFSNYCNKCFCGKDGKASHAACTRMYCDPEIWNIDGTVKNNPSSTVSNDQEYHDTEAEQRCEPNRMFKKFCNICRCPSNGFAAQAPCTRMYCDPAYWSENGSLKANREIIPILKTKPSAKIICQPHRMYENDCNGCVCSGDGESSVCTLMECSSQDTRGAPQVCEPGKSFDIGCNSCSCSNDGLVITCFADESCS